MKKKLILLLTAAMLLTLILSSGVLALSDLTNVALNKTYTASTPYTLENPNKYVEIDGRELTDGVKGSTAFGTEWHAFYIASPYFITVDLEERYKNIKVLTVEFQHNPQPSINKPTWCKFYSSNNGIDFTLLGTATEIDKGSNMHDYKLVLDTPVTGRYFKAEFPKVDGFMFVFASEFEVFVEGAIEIEEPDVVIEPIDVLFTSGCVITDDYLYGVPFNTEYADFLSMLKSTEGIVLKNKSGEVKTSGLIATGDYIEKIQNDELVDTKTIVIEGDVNGDGRLTSADYLLVKRAFLGTYTLTTAFTKAAAITNGTGITTQDYLKIKRHFLGSFNIHAKYKRYEIEEYPMTFQMTSAVEYKMSCTYEGKPLTLTFNKKTWGTWNIGTLSYNNVAMAGGGTDWEYVYRAGQTASSTPFCGGNHENETLVEIKFYDGSTGQEIVLPVGQSVQINNLMIVEKTHIDYHQTTNGFCDVVRTYIISGNKITLEVNYELTQNTYFGLSYTAMFPVHKNYGRYCKFLAEDGTDLGTVTTLPANDPNYTSKFYYNKAATTCIIWGDTNPEYKFAVQIYTVKDSVDNFKNYEKTFYWDMNSTQNKLYFSRYNSSSATLVQAGTKMDTKTSWTFYIEDNAS
ncbi:MAG: hypothetical protein CVU97_04445 [Firmicutes bacterium HGW-Firmicutes-21]|nr:MAG: hypothetical protein CVU97_04445 [Firmicutes bacterium HGW-Firmicutes-21]